MAKSIPELLSFLRTLQELDASLARAKAQQNTLNEERTQREGDNAKAKKKLDELKLEVNAKKGRYTEEESRIKTENEKLVERRKVLTSFGNYKVQQSAQKEIEQTSKQLSAQEEKLLETLEELETAQAELQELEEAFAKEAEEFKTYSGEVEDEIDALINRINEKQGERDELAQKIKPSEIQLYERIRERYPIDPIVSVENGCCGGCHMKLGPQIIVQVSREESLVKCRGCGRILQLGRDSDEGGATSPN